MEEGGDCSVDGGEGGAFHFAFGLTGAYPVGRYLTGP